MKAFESCKKHERKFDTKMSHGSLSSTVILSSIEDSGFFAINNQLRKNFEEKEKLSFLSTIYWTILSEFL